MEIHPENTLVIYTDGSKRPKPNRGGVGMVLVWTNAEGHEESHEHSPPGFFGVTPPQMELQAVIEALRLVDRRSPIVARELYSRIRIYCDASYVVDHHATAKWRWSKSKWRKSGGGLVENADRRGLRLAPSRHRISGAADLPAHPRPELQEDSARRDQLPIRRIVASLLGGGLYVEQRATREPTAQLAGLLIDLRVLNRLANQLGGVGRGPLGVLGSQAPKLSVRVEDLDVEDIGIRRAGIDNRPAHRAQDICGR